MTGGLAVVAGLSFQGAVVAITGGTMLAMIFYVTMATVGADYGIPGQVATRMTFGIRGAKWVPSLLRTIASTYWFAFQTVAGSIAVVAVLRHWTGVSHSLVTVSLIFGVLQAVVAIVGYDSLKYLSRAALPFKILVLGYVMVLLTTHDDPHFRHLCGAGLPRPANLELGVVHYLGERRRRRINHHGDRCRRLLPLHPLALRHVVGHADRQILWRGLRRHPRAPMARPRR